MFYCQEILQRRGGKFGVVWLAAMHYKALTRRECQKVSISKKCDEILNYVMLRVVTDNGSVKRFSLYLSAQLLYGAVRVHFEQSKYLLTDCLEAQKKLQKVFVQASLIAPEVGSQAAKKLLLLEDFTDETTGFDASDPHIRVQVELINESIDFLRDEQIITDYVLLPHSLHTAPKDQITLPDLSTAESSSSLLYPQQIPPEQDLPPLTEQEMNQYFVEPPMLSPIHYVPEDEQFNRHPSEPTDQPPEPMDHDIMQELEQTPAIEAGAPRSAERPEKRPPTDQIEITELDEQAADQQPPKKKSKVASGLVLPPLQRETSPAPTRRRKPRQLIIDDPKSYTKQQIKHRLETHATTCQSPVLPQPAPRLEKLMIEPSSTGCFNSRFMLESFRELCLVTVTLVVPGGDGAQEADDNTTLQQGNDTSREVVRRATTPGSANISLDQVLNRGVADDRSLLQTSQTPLASSAVDKSTQDATAPTAPTDTQVSGDITAVDMAAQAEPIQDNMAAPGVTDLPPVDPGQQTIDQQPADQDLLFMDVMDQQPPTDQLGEETGLQSLVLDDGTVQPQQQALTPKTLSVKDQLTRSLKKHFIKKNTVEFLELTDLIRSGKTPRQEVAKLFSGLLTMTKHKVVTITQSSPFGPIVIRKGPRLN